MHQPSRQGASAFAKASADKSAGLPADLSVVARRAKTEALGEGGCRKCIRRAPLEWPAIGLENRGVRKDRGSNPQLSASLRARCGSASQRAKAAAPTVRRSLGEGGSPQGEGGRDFGKRQ